MGIPDTMCGTWSAQAGAPERGSGAGVAGAGVRFLALSLGIPAWKPHFGRPFDQPVPGCALPPEHPLQGVARHLAVATEIQRSAPGTAVIGAGYSWLL